MVNTTIRRPAFYRPHHSLLVVLFSLIVDNVEESQFIDAFASADNAKPVTQLLFLEEFLCPAF